jgi:alkane 1-monooxygenase
MKKYGFLLAFTLPIAWVIGFFVGGWATYLPFLIAYFFVPLVDELFGLDRYNLTAEETDEASAQSYFSMLLYVWVVMQISVIMYRLDNVEWWGIVLSTMTISSNGINVAHELGHRNEKISVVFAKLNLVTVNYLHFYIEHNRGHHVHVATPLDPATSRKNQNLYFFWVQSLAGGWVNAWKHEANRLTRRNISGYGIYNEMWRAVFLPILFLGLMLGIVFLVNNYQITQNIIWNVSLFWILQSLFAVLSLEAVNYIEHYGIMRREISPNKYERVNPLHSWNASQKVSNWFLFQLQRHSDHHANASRPYQILRHIDESPQLPFGYPLMIMMALVPPIWFAVMNPKLEKWKMNLNLSSDF